MVTLTSAPPGIFTAAPPLASVTTSQNANPRKPPIGGAKEVVDRAAAHATAAAITTRRSRRRSLTGSWENPGLATIRLCPLSHSGPIADKYCGLPSTTTDGPRPHPILPATPMQLPWLRSA